MSTPEISTGGPNYLEQPVNHDAFIEKFFWPAINYLYARQEKFSCVAETDLAPTLTNGKNTFEYFPLGEREVINPYFGTVTTKFQLIADRRDRGRTGPPEYSSTFAILSPWAINSEDNNFGQTTGGRLELEIDGETREIWRKSVYIIRTAGTEPPRKNAIHVFSRPVFLKPEAEPPYEFGFLETTAPGNELRAAAFPDEDYPHLTVGDCTAIATAMIHYGVPENMIDEWLAEAELDQPCI